MFFFDIEGFEGQVIEKSINFDFGVCQPGRYYKIFIMMNGPYGDEVFEESRIFNVEI